MKLKLECGSCGKRFKAEVGKAFVDLSYFDKEKLKKEESERAISFRRNVKCPRCDAMETYRLTANALSHLMVECLKVPQKGVPSDEDYYEGKHEVVIARFGLRDGRIMSPREAEKFYGEKLVENPNNGEFHLRLGNVLSFMGRTQEAFEEYQRSVEVNPDDPESWYNLGMLNKKFGMIRDAEKAFLKCVETATQRLTSKDEELYIKLIAASQEELDKL